MIAMPSYPTTNEEIEYLRTELAILRQLVAEYDCARDDETILMVRARVYRLHRRLLRKKAPL